jgi:hypothetical protein
MNEKIENEFDKLFGEQGNLTNGQDYQFKIGVTPRHIKNWLRTTLLTEREAEVRREERERMVEWCETPLSTHEGVRAKTVEDVIEYLTPKEAFKCPMDCGVEQNHTHPDGNIKKVFIRADEELREEGRREERERIVNKINEWATPPMKTQSLIDFLSDNK